MAESSEIFDTFMARKCEVCRGRKVSGSAFCRWCYRELPKALQSSLWKRFGSGFEEAYQASLSWFRTHPVETRKQGAQESLFGEKA